MKLIKILISDDTEAPSVIMNLESQIPEHARNTPEFSVTFPQAVSCIEDFAEKAKRLAKAGTTIHIKKEFTFPGANVLVILDYPRRVGFLEKLAGILKSD